MRIEMYNKHLFILHAVLSGQRGGDGLSLSCLVRGLVLSDTKKHCLCAKALQYSRDLRLDTKVQPLVHVSQYVMCVRSVLWAGLHASACTHLQRCHPLRLLR